MRRPRAAALVAWLAVSACSDKFSDPQVLGGVTVSAEVLNRGMARFRRDCTGCHGDDGRGTRQKGPKEATPRNLTLGFYKYGSVPNGGLPTDADLTRVVREGLAGTQMEPRPDLDQAELHAVIQYVKTFAPRWRTETAGVPVAEVPDPWAEGPRRDAVWRGFEVYHGTAQCWSCHPAYASIDNIQSIAGRESAAMASSGQKRLKLREDMSRSALVETRYGNVLPPDFLSDRVRAARGLGGLYRAIAAGVGGTPMPASIDHLSPKDLWAVVYYIHELSLQRGLPGAARYRVGVPGWENPAGGKGIPALETRSVQEPQVP